MKKVEKTETTFLPTPLHKLTNVSLDLQHNIYIKRDDLTSIGMGGNKLRKLDYLVHDALKKGYTTLLTYGGPQTNHGRLTAAVAAKYGLKAIIMCFGKRPDQLSGNLVLDKILGADVRFIDTTAIMERYSGKAYDVRNKQIKELKDKETNNVMKEYEAQGDKVYSISVGGHGKLGVLGYFSAMEEIMNQEKELGIQFDHIVLGNGSGGTLGGVLLGKKYFKMNCNVHSINISESPKSRLVKLINMLNDTSNHLDMGVKISYDDFHYYDDYQMNGYNIPDPETRKAIYYLARKEAIFTDPCYTGKAFNGLLGLIKQGVFKKDVNILFLHTGGLPGIWTKEHVEAFDKDLWKKGN